MAGTTPPETQQRHSALPHRQGEYHKARDRRNRPIRGLWVRNGRYYARLAVPDPKGGRIRTRRIPIEEAETVAQAVEKLHALRLARKNNDLPATTRTPKLEDIIQEYIDAPNGKADSTRDKERCNLTMWGRHIGSIRLNHLTPADILRVREERLRQGVSNRTANLDLITLRQLLKFAEPRYNLRSLPTDRIDALSVRVLKRHLASACEIAALCRAARRASRNGRQFANYVLLMAYSGCRRNEALRIRWKHVDFARRQLTILKSKNGKTRVVPFNPKLERLLLRMYRHRAPDSVWTFPSPQRGETDKRTTSFEATYRKALAASGILEGRGLPPLGKRPARKRPEQASAQHRGTSPPPNPPAPNAGHGYECNAEDDASQHEGFHIHDLRHYFISHCVMSGIDYMTIADWVGHQDGGRLIGMVYGHLADGHSQQQAKRVSFAH